jgi:hypothetical protein
VGLYQIKQFAIVCDEPECIITDETLAQASITRKRAELMFRFIGWGRTAEGRWLCPEHITRNAGAQAMVGRKRQ